MKPLLNQDSTLAFADDIDVMISQFPATTLSLLRKIDDKYDDNIHVRLAQELLAYDECLYETLGGADDDRLEFFATVNDFLSLCIEFIRAGDELPIYLVGDYYNITLYNHYVVNDLRPALETAMEFVKAEKYADVQDASTDMFVAVLSTTYDFVVD